ncbi:hypothetical protein WY02_26505 [Pseudonocardia sp. AL041005-10]|nr:hypothetical protein WY02_26505 [Pseudonocardia sp. AL041005-10]
MTATDLRPVARGTGHGLRLVVPGELPGGAPAVPCPPAAPARPSGRRVPPQPPEVLLRSVGPVLAGLAFPAQRWQVLAEADAWGAPGVLRRLLAELPSGRYADLDSVVRAVRTARPRRRIR